MLKIETNHPGKRPEDYRWEHEMNKNGEPRYPALRAIAMILANLTAILSANYIVFFILDYISILLVLQYYA